MKRISLIKVTVLTILLSFTIAGCRKSNTTKFDVGTIKRLSNLESLVCTFKTVADLGAPAYDIGIVKFGKNKYFIEYNAIVTVAVDLAEIKYNEKDNTLIIPKAKIADVKHDPNSIKESSHDNFLSSISSDDRKKLVNTSLAELEKNLINNGYILRQGQEIAASQVKSFVDNVFRLTGKEAKMKYELEK